ncbi:MAG: PAS domain S-box protein, partial [Candidatus Brocadiia bacterium]
MKLAKKTSRELIEEVRFLRLRVRELEEKRGASHKSPGRVLSAAEDLHLFLNSLPDLIAIIDNDHRIVKINKAMADRLGVLPGDAVGEFCYKCVHGEGEPPSFCPHSKLLHDGLMHCQEVNEEKLGGTFLVSVVPIRDNQGNTVGSIHVAQDITEQKSAEEKIRFHAQLLDNVRESIIATDLAGQILYWGKGAETLYRYPSEEMVGKIIYVIDESLDEDEEQKRLHDILSKGVWKGQCRQKRRDGSVFWADIIMSVVKDSNGQPYGLMRVDRDITEKKKAELAILKSEQSANAILNATLESLFLLDKDGTIRLVNTTGAERVGRSVNELIGQKIYNFFPPELVEKRYALIEEVIRSGTPIQSEDRRGEMDYLNCIYPVFDHNGKVEGVAVFAEDITPRKRWEQILRNIAEGVSAATGEEFFRLLTQYLAKTLGTAYAFVGEISGDSKDHIRTLAVYANGEIVENIEYELPGSPCENVVGKKICSYPSDVAEIFPQDGLLRQMGAESYVGAPLFDSSGKPIGIIAVVDTKPLDNPDLAETMLQIFAVRTKAELDRKKAEDELKWFFDLVPDMVCIASKDGFFKKINRAWEVVLGFSKEEMLATPFMDLIHPDDRSATLAEVEKQIAGSRTIEFINRYRCKDGSYRWFEWMATPAVDKKLLFAAARDITERKRSEEALHESEERFRVLFESAPDTIFLMDMAGNFVDGNKVSEELSGYKKEELIGKNFADVGLLQPAQIETAKDFLERVFRGESAGPIEFDLIKKDRSSVAIEIRSFPVTIKGQVLSLCIARDVSERKKAEDALMESRDNLTRYLEIMESMILVLDQQSKVCLINRKGCEILGYKQEDVIGKDWFEH